MTTEVVLRVYLVLLGCTLSGIEGFELSSTLSEGGRSLVCNANSQVTYRCRTNGTILEWSLPQFGAADDSIIFLSSNSPGLSSNVRNAEVWAVLISVAPMLESILTIETSRGISPLNIFCVNSANDNLTVEYTVATPLSCPSSISHVSSQAISLCTQADTVAWTPPEDMTDFDFYEVNCTGPSTFDTYKVRDSSISVVAESYSAVSVRTVNKCGQRSIEVAIVSLERNTTYIIVAVVVSLLLVLILLIIATLIGILIYLGWCKSPKKVEAHSKPV